MTTKCYALLSVSDKRAGSPAHANCLRVAVNPLRVTATR